jgi:hypothetical protein
MLFLFLFVMAYSVFLAIWVFLLALVNDFLCEKPVQKALAKAV